MGLRSAALGFVLALAAEGCLSSVNTDPHGYRCSRDADCAGGLRCVAALCTDPSPFNLPVYRLNSTADHGQRLTADAGEVAALVAAGAYTSDGVVFLAPSSVTDEFFPVYLMSRHSINDYLYSTSNGERRTVLANGDWSDGGVVFFALRSGGDGSVPVYRVTQNTFHHYAFGNDDLEAAIAKGYNFDDGGGASIWEMPPP